MVIARAARLGALGAAALFAASCSFTRLAYMNAGLAYSNATPVLTWMVSDYVDLSGAQRDFVRDRLSRAFAWHRADELPEFRGLLEKVLRDSEDGITADEARAAFRSLRERYDRLVERLLPDVADLLLKLDAGQAAQMERAFAEDNRKMMKEAARGTPGERFERRVKRALEHFEEFTGPLGEAQAGLVAKHLAAMEDTFDERLADRRYRQAQAVAIARARPARDDAIAALRRLLVDTDTWRAAEYRKKLASREEKMVQLLAALSATLSPQQRSHFDKRVRGFMRDITELTATN